MSTPSPRVFVRLAHWDDIYLLDGCILPAVRDGSLLQIVADPALLHRIFDLDDPHYTIFRFPSRHVSLLYALVAMPSLLELSIRMEHLSDITPETEAAQVPFRLRRLALYPVFRG
ncbi:hypothetical protein EXIGLDRAFT_771517 [Exidia glandulosa HHB12029]|uniref:Uncharacterized protein n=1 Tax=Exidia glandulosa HHB12029 TaxID=1314781 RepID=A0A165FXZ4_EXIGL|nr:hypothetical protein EXIGLDRAFT_771517 [Exidia glandulosa HHB12029]